MLTTTNDMYLYTLQGVNKQASGTITPLEWNRLINQALDTYVERRYGQVDKDQKAMDDLRMLMQVSIVNNTGTSVPEGELFQLPVVAAPVPVGTSIGYRHMLNLGVKLFTGPGTAPVAVACASPGGWTSARPLPRDGRYAYDRNPFWKPTITKPYYDLEGNVLRIRCGGGAWAGQVRMEYLRYPVLLSVTAPVVEPELPPHVNRAICDLAVTLHLEEIESRRTPIHAQVTQS